MSRDTALVSADWAEKNLDAPGVVFVEVDEDTTPTTPATSPAPIKLDWKTDLQDQVRRDFVNKSQFEALLSERGIGNDDIVVLYGGNNNWFAAYAYWYFKLYGHRDVKLLDGGRKKWELDARPLVNDAVDPPGHQVRRAGAGPLDPRLPRRGRRRHRHARTWSTCARPDEFAGRLLAPAHLPQEQAQRAGHIPTAISVPWCKAANEDGTFKSDDELRKIYADAGLDDSKDDHRLLPDRRALLAHLVRAAGAARPAEREELRRLLDRVRLAGRRAGRARRRARGGLSHDCSATAAGCAAPDQSAPLPASVDLEKETVITGVVLAERASPSAGAYVRLLDATGEFTAEVVTSPTGPVPVLRRAGQLDPAGAVPARQRRRRRDRRPGHQRGLRHGGLTHASIGPGPVTPPRGDRPPRAAAPLDSGVAAGRVRGAGRRPGPRAHGRPASCGRRRPESLPQSRPPPRRVSRTSSAGKPAAGRPPGQPPRRRQVVGRDVRCTT